MKINYQLFFLIISIAFFGILQPVKGQTSTSGKTVVNKTTSGSKVKWTAKAFDYNVFIENQGQFEGPQNGGKILYGAKVGDVYAFITTNGIVYNYTESPEVHPSADKTHYVVVDPDEVNPKLKPIQHYLTATWEGGNYNVTSVAGDEQVYYYTYPTKDGKGTIKANIFKAIICKDVYPGIDVKYMFPADDKGGIKYNLIVHPGADLSVVKLKYDGAKTMLINKDGDVEINSGWGQFVDHAPVSYYDADNNHISSSYQLNNKVESFSVNNIDPTKTLVVDPWSTNWTTTYSGTSGYNGAYDLDFDYAGNVYIYGGYNPFQVAKYNSAGVQQWTYNTTNFPNIYYGAFCVDKSSGVTFAFEGFGGGGFAYTDKISSTGALITQLTTNTLDEQWRAAYDLCSHTIAIAGGGISQSLQAATLDTNMVTYNSVNVLNLPPATGYHDLCLIASDPIVDTTYMASTWTYANTRLDNNVLMRMPMPSLAPTSLLTYDKFNFQEVGSISYVGYGVGVANGMNGMAISPNWLYGYDGDTLRQIDKNTGAIHNSVDVSPPPYFAWGGLSVDLCDNIYLGNKTNVDIYNVSLAMTGSIGPFPGNVYDAVLGNGVLSSQDSTLYVCGKGFVSSVKIDPPSPPTIVKTRTHVCSCNCTATGTLNFCGNVDTASNVSYKWSNGQTTRKATGLCPGNTYTLTIKLGCALQYQDTFDIPLTGTLNIVKAQINSTCVTPGSASVNVSGGMAPYTYLWSNGATTSNIAGLNTGTDCVTITDNKGCQDSVCFIISGTPLPTIVATSALDSICLGSPGVGLNATGGVSYTWAPSNGLTCVSCANPTATPLVTTTYTVTGTDANGCVNKDSLTIKVNPLPIVTVVPQNDTVCSGQSVTLTASTPSGTGYVWQPGGMTGASVVVTPTVTTTYVVTGTDVHGCSSTASTIVYFQNPPTITVTSTKSSICAGATTAMIASAMNTTSPFTWQPGNMHGPTVIVTPTVTTTYTVSASSGCGLAVATITISVNPLPATSFYSDNLTGCAPLCIQFRDRTTCPEPISQWVWSFGNGDSLQSQSPIYCYKKSGSYSVSLTTLSDSGCSSTLSVVNYITVYTGPLAKFSLSPQPTDILAPTIQFTDLSTDAYGLSERSWNFGESGDTISNLQNPRHVYQDTGTYCPTLIVMNGHGCADTVTNCLIIDPLYELYIPSAFTPNGDGKNEVFIPKGNDVTSFEMYIFDRWGMQLFHSTDMKNGWNGTVKGGSTISSEDTYVYLIHVYDTKHKEHTYTGRVTLLK